MGRLLAVGLLVVAAGIAVVVVNGPGADKPDESDAARPERSTPRTQAGSEDRSIAKTDRSAEGTRVRMRDLRFAPSSVRVAKGEPVLFVNDDDVAHVVYQDLGATSGKSATVDSARIAPGETFTFTPAAAGELRFVCPLHATVMRGRVEVT